MKLAHTVEDGVISIEIHGELDASQCNCLTAYWTRHVRPETGNVRFNLDGLDTIDGVSIAALIGLIRERLDGGTSVSLHDAPQMLAHTLYKVGMLDRAGMSLITPRSDEQPYA